jgi:hypothetical protein
MSGSDPGAALAVSNLPAMSQIGDRQRPSQPGRGTRPSQQKGGGRPNGPGRRPPSGRGRGRSGPSPMRRAAIPGAIALVVLVVLIVVIVVVTGGSTPSKSTPDYNPAAAGVVSDLTGVPQSVYDAVKVPAGVASPPTAIKGTALTASGKPEVLYMGDEWCPYCGATRWSVIAALSRFGTFSGLKTTLSSSSDVDPDTNTFSFVGATYSSPYISFVSDEMQNTTHGTLEAPSAANAKLLSTYDTAGSVPFIDFGNKYVVSGTYDPAVLQGLSWSQIASQLNTPTARVTKSILGSANFMSSIICKLTNGQPGSVCTSPGVAAGAAVLAQAK